MKKYMILAAILAVCSGAYADSAVSTPPMQVTVQSDVKDLAKGYAAAFGSLTNTPFTLVMQKEGSVRRIEDIKTVKDSDGVLIVTTGKGLTYIVNPRDIIYITDGEALKALPNGA